MKTGTHWDSSHQPMDPCTPPEFLKMASHGPSYIVHVYRCRTLCCVFSLPGQKHIRPILLAEEKKWGRCMKRLALSDHKRAEGKHLTVAYAVGKSNCSRNCGTLHHTIRGCHHTSTLSILGEIMWGGDALFLFNISLWEFISDSTLNGMGAKLRRTSTDQNYPKTRTWDGSDQSWKLTLESDQD